MAALRLPHLAYYSISQNYFIVFWLQELILRAAFNFQLSKALLTFDTFEGAILLRATIESRAAPRSQQKHRDSTKVENTYNTCVADFVIFLFSPLPFLLPGDSWRKDNMKKY